MHENLKKNTLQSRPPILLNDVSFSSAACALYMCYCPDSDVKSAMTVWITRSTCAMPCERNSRRSALHKIQLLVHFSCVRSA